MTRMTIASPIACTILIVAAAQPCQARQAETLRLTVDEAVARGLATSHRLAEVTARERGAQAAVRGALAAEKPTVAAGAGYSRTNHVLEFGFTQPNGSKFIVYPDIPDNFITRVGMQWPIYTSGRTDAMERAALAEAQAIGADLDAARADLRLEITRSYWAVATAREAAQVIEESVARAEAQVKDARDRFAVGVIPPNEVSSLEAQRSRELAQLIEARNFRESTLVDLRRLVGAGPDIVIELAEGLDTGSTGSTGSVEAVVAEALRQRPERKSLTFRIGGAEAREQVALTGNKPVVGFGAGVDYANPNAKIFPRQGIWQTTWDLSVNATWMFFDGGRTKAQASEARAVVDATRERLSEFDAVVAADVRQRMLDLDSSRAMVVAASDAVRSAADARRVVGDRFAAGVATSTDVLVSQVALLENQLARTRALANVKLAEARLQRSVGRP